MRASASSECERRITHHPLEHVAGDTIVPLLPDVGAVIAMTADGRILEGRRSALEGRSNPAESEVDRHR
jgi:hypothetical protein